MLACLLLTGDDFIFESVYTFINTGESLLQRDRSEYILISPRFTEKQIQTPAFPLKAFIEQPSIYRSFYATLIPSMDFFFLALGAKLQKGLIRKTEAGGREAAVCVSDGIAMERRRHPGETLSGYSLCCDSQRSGGGESMRGLTRCGEGLASTRT